MKQIDLSIIIVHYNTPKEVINAVKSIKDAVGIYSYQIIIIDNDSSKKIPREMLIDKKIEYQKRENSGYGVGLNHGSKLANGRFLVFANSDIIFQKNSISLMIEKMKSDSSIGIMGPAFLDQKGKIRKVGNTMPIFPDVIFALSSLNKMFPNNYFSKKYFIKDFDRKTERKIPVLCGACMLVRADIFRKIKGFDKRFFMYFEEADICYRINKLGFKIFYFPHSRVVHFVGKSTNNLEWIKKTFEHSRYEFLKKYHGYIMGTAVEIIIRLINLPAKFV